MKTNLLFNQFVIMLLFFLFGTGAVCGQTLSQDYNHSQNYYSGNFQRNLELVNTVFQTNYSNYTGQNPGNLNSEFMETPWPPGSGTSGSTHKGVDYRAQQPFNLYSPLEGVVTGTGGGSGKICIYNSTYSLTFIFIHCSESFVNVGDMVIKGQLVGKTGEVGAPDSPHLHVELRSGYRESAQTSSGTALTNYDPRIIIDYFPPSLSINQTLSIYGGTVANPKEINVYFKATDFNSNESTTSSFSVPYFNIKNPATNVLMTVPSNYISQLPSTTVAGVVWRHFKVDLSYVANNSNLPTNGFACDIGFDVVVGSLSKHFHGDKQLYFLDPSSLTDIGVTNDKWYDKYVKDGVDYGLFRGGAPSNATQSVSFNPSGLLTKSQAAAAVVVAGVKLGVLNINTLPTQNASYAYYDDVPPSDPYFKYVQTLKNYGITGDVLEFGENQYITQDRFCKWVAMACGISSANIDQSQYFNTAVNINYISTDSTLQPYVDILTKTPSIRSSLTGDAIIFIEPIYSPFDFSTVTTLTMPSSYVCNKNVTRDIMAKVMTLAYEFKLTNSPNAQGRSIADNNSIPSDFIAYGEKYDNASITATSTPITPSQQAYSCSSGDSVTIYYNPGSLPQHYYWSMVKNGATLTSNNAAHSSVTFSAPDNIAVPTQWKLYTYTANNKGKSRETYITINVEPTNMTVPAPTWVEINSYSSDGIEIQWDSVGNGITNYQAQYSQDPSFSNNVVSSNVTSSNLTMYWTIQGLQNGTFYARVKAINSSGVSSPWSNVVSYSLNADSQPFIYSVTPAVGSTISGSSVTLNFQATGGNAPLTYTVYFSTWNPLGNPPVATNLSNAIFTVNDLAPNNTYVWAVKVVDADGDVFTTNNYSINTQPSTIIPIGTISIENGSATTNSISVNLNASATAFSNGTITGMRFSNDGTTWPETWEQYNLNRPAWSLVGYGGTSTPGVKTVYVQFRDNSGNISQTYSDNITLVAGARGIFIVRDKTFESLRAANEYAISGDIIYATAGYFDLTSEKGSVPYLPYTTSIGGGIKNGVSLIGEGADKTTLFWDGTQTQGLGLAGNNTIQGITFIVTVNQNVSRATLMLHGASNIMIKNCIFKNGDNSIESFNYYGNTTANTNISVINNLFFNNNSKAINIRNCNGLTIYNNTINNNGYACFMIGDSTNLNIKNNIVSNNKAEAVYIFNYTNLDFKNNNVFNNRFSATSAVENYVNFSGHLSDQTGLNSNISVDPLFVSSASNNFNLNTNSPCINSGINVGLPYFGVAPEIGVYELGGTGSLLLTSNVTSSFLITKPDGTQQTYNNGQTISNLAQGIYGIYPQAKVGYYSPNDSFIYININETKNHTGNYTLDTLGPEGKIYLNGDAYSSQSPYVTIFCDVVDKINGLENGLMQFSNDGINWTTPEPVKNKKLLWDLSNDNIPNLTAGSKTVYAKFSDKNGYWSNIITDNIEYIPSGKIKIIEPNNNIANLDFRNDILSAQLGDILLLKEGTHTVFGGSVTLPIGITLQGVNKFNSVVRNVSSIYFKHGFKYDNLKFYAPASQQFYSNLSNTEEPLESVISNCVFDHNSVQLINRFKTIFANNIFKDSSLDTGLLNLYSNHNSNSIRIINNVFDASVNTSALNTEIGINSRLCCSNNFEVNNNNFIGFNLGTDTGVYMGGSVLYSNSASVIGDMLISNNNFYDCLFKIMKFNGVDITKDKFSYNHYPNFNTDYSIPQNSSLSNSGKMDLFFNNHNNTTNDIGVTGGIYYNTPPTVNLMTQEIGYNQFKFTANASDGQTPVEMLQFRWDFNNDGIMDTPFLLTNETVATITTTNDLVVCYVFDELFAIGYQIIPSPTASNINLSIAQPQPLAICAGTSSPFQTNATGNFNQGCEFKIIYSGPNGDFENPQFTQNLTSQPNGIVNVMFPSDLPTCTTCYVKLVSTNPVNSSSIAIAAVYQAPQATISINPGSIIICPNESVTFTATSTNGGSSPVYTWKKNGLVVGSNSTYTDNSLNNGDNVWVEMLSNQPCASLVPVASTPTTIQVTQIDGLFIQAIDNILAASIDVGIQWIRNGLPIEGANSQFYEATQTGFYQFSATVNGCTVFSDIYQLSTLGVNNNISENVHLIVYPNPSNNILNIESLDDIIYNLILIDLQGRKILEQKVNDNYSKINIQNLPSAIYLLQIETERGKQTVKVIKE